MVMAIDARVNPAFYLEINGDLEKAEFRHEALGIWKNGLASTAHVKAQMDCAGLDRQYLHASFTDGGTAIVSNDEVACLVASDPVRFGGVASVDPFAMNGAQELERAISDLGLDGLYLSPGWGHYRPGDERLHSLYEICIRHDVPVIFAAGLQWEPGTLAKYGRPIEFEEVALGFPKLRFCLTQFGWPWAQESVMLALKYPNVYLDMGMLHSGSAREWYRRVFTVDVASEWIDRSLRHQVLFASGAPRFEQIRMKEALGQLPLRDSTLDLIRGGNAEAFFRKGSGE